MQKQNTFFGRGLKEFDRASVVANYFGFTPTVSPQITRRDMELVKDCSDHIHYDVTEKMAVVRTCLENKPSPMEPTALIYEKPVSRRKYGSHALHFIGSSAAVAEAALVRAALSILTEEGHKNLRVELNCMGDKESIGAYERELLNHVRKVIPSPSEELRHLIKSDVFHIFRLGTPEMVPVLETAPPAITFLSAQSRAHFKEVLEYIEALGIEFRLAPRLVGDKNHASQTIFAVKNTVDEKDNTLALGYRYSRLGRYLGLRRELPAAGVNIFCYTSENARRKIYKKLPKPKFYLIQLGREAKIKTLGIIEFLRLHRIPLYHLIGRDKITAQLSEAESLHVPYLVIIGQKEALENTATIRNVSTRAQDTVSLKELPRYLKNLS